MPRQTENSRRSDPCCTQAGQTLGFFVNERLLSIILNFFFLKRLASPPQNIGWTNVKKSFKSRVTPLNLIHEWGTHFQHLINRLYLLIFLSNSNMKSLFFGFRERFLFLLSSAKTVGVSLELTSLATTIYSSSVLTAQCLGRITWQTIYSLT